MRAPTYTSRMLFTPVIDSARVALVTRFDREDRILPADNKPTIA